MIESVECIDRSRKVLELACEVEFSVLSIGVRHSAERSCMHYAGKGRPPQLVLQGCWHSLLASLRVEQRDAWHVRGCVSAPGGSSSSRISDMYPERCTCAVEARIECSEAPLQCSCILCEALPLLLLLQTQSCPDHPWRLTSRLVLGLDPTNRWQRLQLCQWFG